jgi:hypothetical protein
MNFSHPAFSPYLNLLDSLDGETSLEALNRLAAQLRVRHASHADTLRFVTSAGAASAADYEMGIASSGTVPTRENNPHDFLNALVWLRFPQLKSSFNLRHCQAVSLQPEEHKRRGRLRDQLTLLDESGLLAISSRPELLELLHKKCWVELFWDARTDVIRHMQFIVIGHGLLEKCLAPFPGMTAKCLFLQTPENSLDALDELAARSIRDSETLELPPLPVQGVPGWDHNESRGYYLNTEIFRPALMPEP